MCCRMHATRHAASACPGVYRGGRAHARRGDRRDDRDLQRGRRAHSSAAAISRARALDAREPPYPDLPTRKGIDDGAWSYPKFLVLRQTQTVFDDLALYSEAQFNISTGAGDAERVRGEWITRGYLPTLGLSGRARPKFLGRRRSSRRAARGGHLRCALATSLHADPAIIGRVIDVNRAAVHDHRRHAAGLRRVVGER